VVDLLPGVSAASPLSAPVAVTSGQGLQVTLTYPSDGTHATIRADYPDPLLASNAKAELNALFVTVYVQLGAVLKRFASLLLIDGPTQTFEISDWNAGTVIGSIPGATNSKFCLFEAVSATASTIITGNFPAGNAQVAYAFQYDGSSVSAISHARTDGCLHTSTLDQADLEASVQYWGIPVATFASLPTTGSIIGQIVATLDTDTLYRWTGTTWTPLTNRRYWGDPVANVAALPTTATTGEVRLTLDTGKLYRWTGSAWTLASGGGVTGNGVLNSWRLG
jgi:hypothetical protein